MKPSQTSSKRTARLTNPAALRQAALRQLPHRIMMRGVLTFPVVPELLEFFVERLAHLFSVLGRASAPEQTQQLRQLLSPQLARGFRESPYSRVVVAYHTDPQGKNVNYKVTLEVTSVREQYKRMLEAAGRELFAPDPDTFALALLEKNAGAKPLRVLEIGAGLGRNAFELARRGHAVDVVEITPEFAEILRQESEAHGLALGVHEGDGISRLLALARNHYDVVFLCDVVTSHVRSPAHLERLFERSADLLKPGGVLLFNAFVVDGAWKLDDLVRKVAEVFWTVPFLPEEIEVAAGKSAFEALLNEAPAPLGALPRVYSWLPVTPIEWAELRHVFALPPDSKLGELRWLGFRKTGSSEAR